jgi:hypothetical protein
MKRQYIQPSTEIYPLEPFTSVLEGSIEEKRTGYAIDNDEANPDNIIKIEEQDNSIWNNDFVEID